MEMKTNPIIYIAGPYRGRSPQKTNHNIKNAARVAAVLRKAGYVCVVPHLESLYEEKILTEDQWIQHGLSLLKRCDCVVTTCIDISSSKGSMLEVSKAEEWGILVFYGVDAFFENEEELSSLPFYFESSKKRMMKTVTQENECRENELTVEECLKQVKS